MQNYAGVSLFSSGINPCWDFNVLKAHIGKSVLIAFLALVTYPEAA